MIRYCAVSAIENSHRMAISDIQWVPDHIEVRIVFFLCYLFYRQIYGQLAQSVERSPCNRKVKGSILGHLQLSACTLVRVK